MYRLAVTSGQTLAADAASGCPPSSSSRSRAARDVRGRRRVDVEPPEVDARPPPSTAKVRDRGLDLRDALPAPRRPIREWPGRADSEVPAPLEQGATQQAVRPLGRDRDALVSEPLLRALQASDDRAVAELVNNLEAVIAQPREPLEQQTARQLDGQEVGSRRQRDGFHAEMVVAFDVDLAIARYSVLL